MSYHAEEVNDRYEVLRRWISQSSMFSRVQWDGKLVTNGDFLRKWKEKNQFDTLGFPELL
jgi:hypothetical protein